MGEAEGVRPAEDGFAIAMGFARGAEASGVWLEQRAAERVQPKRDFEEEVAERIGGAEVLALVSECSEEHWIGELFGEGAPEEDSGTEEAARLDGDRLVVCEEHTAFEDAERGLMGEERRDPESERLCTGIVFGQGSARAWEGTGERAGAVKGDEEREREEEIEGLDADACPLVLEEAGEGGAGFELAKLEG